MTVKAVSTAAVVFGALHLSAATPALPDAVDGVVTLEAQDYVLTEADDISGITQFNTTGGWLIFDVATTMDVTAKINGTGGIAKRGEGKLYLKSNAAIKDYYTTLGIHAQAGELHLPEAVKTGYLPEYGIVNIDAAATVFVVGSNTQYGPRTLFKNLTGSGILTNAWNVPALLQQADSSTSTNFSGVIGGKFDSIWIYPKAKLTLTGTNSSFTVANWFPGFGKIYVKKIGYDENENSSIGRTTMIKLGPNKSDAESGLYYIGENGETTVKTLVFSPWGSCLSTARCVLDAGAGGLTWNGAFDFDQTSPMVHAILQGDGDVINVFGGTMMESEGSSYLEKRGAGTWRIKGDNSRKGVTAVTEGTLQFETLRECGMPCSLGISTLTHSAYSGEINNDNAVPYAFLLGGGSTEAVFECVGREGDASSNIAGRRPLALAGDGRLKTSCPQLFAISGVSSVSSDPCTLTLDGTNTASTLFNVTDGTSALSITKTGSGTWKLSGEVDFSGSLEVNQGTLVVETIDTEIPYSWYKYTMKTLNSFYSGTIDSCRVTGEFALYDEDGVRRNIGLVSNTNQVPTALAPGEATVAADQIPGYKHWAFTEKGFLLSNMFDDNSGTSSYLAGRGNGTNENNWISVVMRLPEGTPAIKSFDLHSTGGIWNQGQRRIVAYSVSGSQDGFTWYVLSEQTTNETARFTSGWYSDGSAFQAGAIRTGIEIESTPDVDTSTFLSNVVNVTVAEGAVLKAEGSVYLRKLGFKLEANGSMSKCGGTIEGFAIAQGGVFNIDGVKPTGIIGIPYIFSDIEDKANFSTWTVAVNGVETESLRLAATSSGLRVYGVGTSVIIR